VVASANDLNPLRVSDLRNTAGPKLPVGPFLLGDIRAHRRGRWHTGQ
jgi:hypothetical protein